MNGINLGNVVSWFITIGIGIVIIGLIKKIWNGIEKRIDDVYKWKNNRPSTSEILLKTDHIVFCDNRMEKTMGIIKESQKEIKEILKDHKEYFNNKIEEMVEKVNNRK